MSKDTWQTPPEWVERVRNVFNGEITLDPAASPDNNVGAKLIYANNHFNGLEQPWYGSVFCNPPYSQGKIKPFCEKAVKEWDACRITEMIMLTNSDTSTQWSRLLLESAHAVCFPYKRLAFIDPDTGEKEAGNNRPQVFWYWGSPAGVMRFRQAFQDHGTIYTPFGGGR